MLGDSQVAAQLTASQEGLISMELRVRSKITVMGECFYFFLIGKTKERFKSQIREHRYKYYVSI